MSNIILNFLLIPLLGVYGAALTTFVSYAITAAVVSRLASAEFDTSFDFQFLIRAVLASCAMALFGAVLGLNSVITIPIGAVMYFISLYLTGGVNQKDIVVLQSMWNRIRA